MSADLFAAFEAPTSKSDSRKNHSQPGTIPAVAAPSDPFSFLATSGVGPGAPHQQNSQQQSFQWQPAPIPTTAAESLWPTAPQPQSQNASNTSVWGDLSNLGGFQNASLPSKQEPPKDEDDDWGDFEAPETTSPTPAVPVTNPPPVRTRVVRASTIDMLSNKLVDLGVGTTSSTLDSWQERPSWEKSPPPQDVRPAPVRAADPNVLFDAADFELQGDVDGEDDDFGDFEAEPPSTLPSTLSAVSSFGATQPTKQPPPLLLVDSTTNAQTDFGSGGLPGASSFGATHSKRQPPSLSLASPTTISNGSLYPQAPKSPYGSFQTRKPDPIKGLKVKTPINSEFPKEVKSRSPSPVTAWPATTEAKDDLDNEWPEFEDLPPDSQLAAKPSTSVAKAIGADVAKLKPTIDTSLSTDTTTTPPPTNVPPPSVLLSIFPQLLDLATTSLLKPISTLPASSQQLVAANEATLIFLQGHLALATVAARIMAGRKHRWHRDKFLMQGMAISAAGGKGGMKLAGIDKTQSAREDREAAEVMSVWKAQVGRLRSAVAAANAAASASRNEMPLKVPELSLSVSAHAAANVVTAPKPCVICGLKREERIAKVDFEVEDSFGEWWVEFWGHRACRNFWLQHEVKLRQR